MSAQSSPWTTGFRCTRSYRRALILHSTLNLLYHNRLLQLDTVQMSHPRQICSSTAASHCRFPLRLRKLRLLLTARNIFRPVYVLGFFQNWRKENWYNRKRCRRLR